MIKAEKLSYSFPQKDLYNKISFTLEDDVHCAFIGTNGTGKSTLVDMILHPDNYLYDGRLIVDVPGRIGYVSQFYSLDEEKEVTVFDYLSEQKAKELLDNLTEVGILNVKNEKYREQEYKDCISSFCPENWVKVLKTLYSRTKRRGSMTSMDKKYQLLLEHALSSEMNYVLGIPAGEMTELIKKSE